MRKMMLALFCCVDVQSLLLICFSDGDATTFAQLVFAQPVLYVCCSLRQDACGDRMKQASAVDSSRS
jgi:hypothetical protein